MTIQKRLRDTASDGFVRTPWTGGSFITHHLPSVTCAEMLSAADRIDSLEAALTEIAGSDLMIHASMARIAREALEASS